MRRHLLRYGEDVISLAARLGCSVSAIWDHADNRELRERRRHPAFLAEGDVVVIPEQRRTEHSVQKGQTHSFRANVPLTTLKLKLVAPGRNDTHETAAETRSEGTTTIRQYREYPAEANEQPMPGVAYRLEIGGRVIEGTTDGSGQLEAQVPAAARFGKLTIAPGTRDELISEIALGLPPNNEDAGILHRVQNLGLAVMHDADDPARALAIAVSTFQAKYGLRVTGELDADTRSAIESHHGV